MEKEKNESYYKILGTTAKIGNGRIREKYIQAVKEHPPETDPEGFEKVRRAYETLKDPVKRKQYDLTRKYGDNVENLMDKAFYAADNQNFQEAAELLSKADEIDPDNQSIKISLMILDAANGRLEEMESHFEKVLEMSSDIQEMAVVYSMKARVLLNNGYDEKALETLEEAKEKYPTETSVFAMPLASIYTELEQEDEAWKVIDSAIPAPEDETIDDLQLFIGWSVLMLQLDKRGLMSKVQSRIRKFLKNLTNQEDKDVAYDQLVDQFEGNYEGADFRDAEFYINLIKVVTGGTDEALKEMMNETKKFARIQKDLERLSKDEDAFPLLSIHAHEWFYQEHNLEEEVSMMLDSIPGFMIDDLKEEKEEYAAGIMRLRKKYPALYKQYKEKWDDLFEELTEGFNREMRRELRRMT